MVFLINIIGLDGDEPKVLDNVIIQAREEVLSILERVALGEVAISV